MKNSRLLVATLLVFTACSAKQSATPVSKSVENSNAATTTPASNYLLRETNQAAQQAKQLVFSVDELQGLKFNSFAVFPSPEGSQLLSSPILGNIEVSLVPGMTCPLVDNQPNQDLIMAAQNLSNQLNSFKTACSGGFIGTNTSEVDAVQRQVESIIVAGNALKGFTEDPSQLSADPAKLKDVQNNVASLIQGIQSISGVLSQNALFGKQCAKNLPTTTDVIMSLSGLIQAATPIAIEVLKVFPEFAPALPFVMGLSAAGNVAQVLGRFQEQGSLNMRDPKIRMAVLQNICEYTRIQQRLSALNEGRMSDLKDQTGELGKFSVLSEKLSMVAPPALLEKMQASDMSIANNQQLKLLTSPELRSLLANRRSAVAESNRRSALSTANASKLSFIELEGEMRITKMALFGKPQALFLSPFSPVYSWYREVESQAKNFQSDFNTQVRLLRNEVEKAVKFSDYGFIEGKNGRLKLPTFLLPWKNRQELQKPLDQVNNFAPMNLQRLKAGSPTHQLACRKIKNILNDWQAVLDHVGSLVEYCDYIRPYMDSGFDDRIVKACVGDLTSSLGLGVAVSVTHDHDDLLRFKGSGLSQLRHQISNDSADDANIIYNKYSELGCSEYYH
jgi:hypothetical protein